MSVDYASTTSFFAAPADITRPVTTPARRTIKGLSLTQPWASLVAVDEKRVETRSWRVHYRGLLAIHAAQSFPAYARKFCYEERTADVLRRRFQDPGDLTFDLPRGVIVAVTELYDIRSTTNPQASPQMIHAGSCLATAGWVTQLSPQERAFGNYSLNRYGWFLRNTVRLPSPVPCLGNRSIWELPSDVRARVEEQLQ